MDLLKAFMEPDCYMYLSGVFVIILGSILGVTTPDTRKKLHTGVAIPLFVAAGLSQVFQALCCLGKSGCCAFIHTLLHFITFSCALELGRRNLNTAFKGKTFSGWWHFLGLLAFVFLSWEYNAAYRLSIVLMVFAAKIFSIAVLLKSVDELPKQIKGIVKTCFIIAVFGGIGQLLIDLNFVKIVDGHYLPFPKYNFVLYFTQILMALAISVLILKRRYSYEKTLNFHVQNKIILFAPSGVFVTSIVVSIFFFAFTKYLTLHNILDDAAQSWMLFIILLVIGILYTILYGISLNGETLKTAEAAQTNFKRIFDSVPYPICVIDIVTSEIFEMNRAMKEHFGFDSDVSGEKLFDYVVSNDKFNCNVGITDEHIVSECVFKAANGKCFSAEVTASYFENEQGKGSALIGIHDVSMFKAIEENLTQAKNSAEEASKLKTRFFSNASHEIRTPMTAIIGLTELAVSICYNENQKKIVELLRFSSKSLMSLINDIFELTEIKNGKLKITKTVFNFKALLEEIIAYSTFHAQREKKKVNFKLSKYLPEYVCSDVEHLGQIILAFLKHSSGLIPDGNIEVEMDLKNESQNKGIFVLRLLNIPVEKKIEIEECLKNEFGFDPYEPSPSRRHSVGISLNSMIIDAMGGNFVFTSDSENGNFTQLNIEIPIEIVEAKPAELNEISDYVFYTNGKPIKFLVADDNDVNLFLAESLIKRFKGLCDCVKDGVETLEALKNSVYDVVLLDIQMPRMDGMKVLEEKRKMQKAIADIPVIAISAFASPEEEDRAIKEGARTYLAKPYFPKDLVDTVGRIFPLDKSLSASVKADEVTQKIESCLPKADAVDKNSLTSSEQILQSHLKRVDYADFKKRIAPKPESIKQLIDIYSRRFATLDIEVDNCINDNDSAKLREVAHSIKGLVGMMSAKYSWEIARNIEKCAADGKMENAVSHISELRLHLAEIGDDLVQIEKFLMAER